MKMSSASRREFLGALGAAASLTAIKPESARGYMANDTIEIACLGTGGRCRTLMQSLVKIPGVRIAGVADIYDKHREFGKALADPKATVTGNFEELLDQKDIDAVLIAAPDHWHAPMTMAACNAGKDVYVEKPLTHDLSEGSALIDVRDRNKRVVQVGTQQRSMPHIQEARALIQGGKIGRVIKVHMTWNRNTNSRFKKDPQGVDPNGVDWKTFLGAAPDQPFDDYRFRNWRWFWDFGGGLLTDLMVHWIDVAHWVLNVDHPLKATTIGSHLASEGVWQTPDTIQTLMIYPNDVQMSFEGTFSNARRGAHIVFMGTDGSVIIDRGGYIIEPERGIGKREEMIVGTNPLRGADFYDKPDGELLHLTNWIDCVRSRERPNAPVEAGVSAASAAHLGNLAYKRGEVAIWVG